LRELIKSCRHREAHVRERACHFLQTFLPALQHKLGNCDILEDLKEAFIERLNDKDAKTRCAATHALSKLLGMLQVKGYQIH
jgi:hypothetical protein